MATKCPARESVDVTDVCMGIFSTLILRGYRIFPVRPFDDRHMAQALHRLTPDVERLFAEIQIDSHFLIKPHEVHGDSPVWEKAKWHCMYTRLITFDSPHDGTMRLHGGEEAAIHRIEKVVPGNRKIYEELTKLFLDYYRQLHTGAT